MAGRLRREKAGNISTATSLLAIRRADKLRGKLPEIKNSKRLLFSELIGDAIKHSQSENDPHVTHDFELKMDRIRPVFGSRAVESITRRELVKWLDAEADDREWKASTFNRWRAAFSLVFRVGITNEKISRNPLSGMRRKHEANDRVRYLSLEEEKSSSRSPFEAVPDYVPLFVLSANTGKVGAVPIPRWRLRRDDQDARRPPTKGPQQAEDTLRSAFQEGCGGVHAVGQGKEVQGSAVPEYRRHSYDRCDVLVQAAAQ